MLRRARVAARPRLSPGPLSLLGYLDGPRPGHLFSQWFTVSGWALSTAGRSVQVRILADGAPLREIAPSIPRPDVAALYPQLRAAPLCGFEARLQKGDLPDGAGDRVEIAVEAREVLGQGRVSRPKPLGAAQVVHQPEALQAHNRGHYKSVWNHVSQSYEEARIAVAGYSDLAEFQRTGESTAATIRELTAMAPQDVVLDIGCGTGRVGAALASRCRRWVGADVSANMLQFARAALGAFPNVSFYELNGFDFSGIEDRSVDVVYATTVFMHLDEWDRYRYVTEMYRVLRPGGRVYYDNFNLLGEDGWKFFLSHCALDPSSRPPNISKSSTPDELRVYAERAGFQDIRVLPAPLWVAVAASKPAGA